MTKGSVIKYHYTSCFQFKKPGCFIQGYKRIFEWYADPMIEVEVRLILLATENGLGPYNFSRIFI